MPFLSRRIQFKPKRSRLPTHKVTDTTITNANIHKTTEDVNHQGYALSFRISARSSYNFNILIFLDNRKLPPCCFS